MSVGTQPAPEDQVRAIWDAYRRGGVDALRELVPPDVEWIPLASDGRPVAREDLWGEWGHRNDARISATVHGFETHGACVLAYGSLRTFRDGGFVDVQPCWAYFFRAGRMIRGAGYATRAAALAAIAEFNAAA